jgi:hypothetical protein
MGIEHQGASMRAAWSSADRDGARDQQVECACNARLRAPNGRFAPRAIARHARCGHGLRSHSGKAAIGDLVDVEDLADLDDLEGEEDEASVFDEETEARAWRRPVEFAKQAVEPTWSALDGSVSAPTKASYLAHRMQELWREAERERRGQQTRLDARMALPIDDMTFEEQCAQLARRLPARSQCVAAPPPFCRSCGTALVAPNSALCRRCQEAEDAAFALAFPSSDEAAPPSLERNCDEPCVKIDPIDAFAEWEFGSEKGDCAAISVPPGRQKSSAEASDAKGWRRLFWLLALLIVCIGIAASVYRLDGVSLPSKEGGRHAGD